MSRLPLAVALSLPLLVGCVDVTVPDADGYAAVREALTIEPTALPTYAAITLPASVTPGLLAREDRSLVSNPITDAGATLGRVLFFDTQLSRSNTVSCASCHAATAAFGDSARFSLGHDGVRRTALHSMRLVNARFNASGRYFWNMRAPSLQAQVTDPIQDELEMGFDAAHGGIEAAIARLEGLAYYPPLFRLAFGDATITEARMQRALAQYVKTLVAFDSRWDRGIAAVTPPGAPPNLMARLPGFTDEEFAGQLLFMRPVDQGGAGCQGCHVAPTFSIDPQSQSNGLDAGDARIFRAPSLKNVAQSSRFMHDGRFASLDEVVEFYDSGVQPTPSLDPRLLGPGGEPRRLGLSAAQRAALVAFLRTLSDESLATDPRFRDPFRRP